MGNSSSSKNKKTLSPDGSPVIPKGTKDIHDVFAFGKELGRGHFASVCRAVHKPTKTEVAIKIINRKQFDKNAEMVKREVDILLKVGMHDNIVNMIDTFQDKTHFYIIMEFCAGGDLFGAIVNMENNMSELMAANYMKQMALAIQYIHSLGITHRDLKPENILLTSKDIHTATLKIADFGLSRVLAEPSAQMRTVCGTWAYCAPEVIMRKPYGPEVDTWTLGVLMFVLLSGYHPFDMYGDLPEPQLLRAIKKVKFDFDDPAWEPVSQVAKDTISRLLCFDPAKRMTVDDFLKSEFICGKERPKRVLPNVKSRMTETVDPRRRFRTLVLVKLAAKQFQKAVNHNKRHIEVNTIKEVHSEIEDVHGIKSPTKGKDEDKHFQWVVDPLHPTPQGAETAEDV